MNRLLAFLICACVGIGGCAGPAEAQSDPVAHEQRARMAALQSEHTKEIALIAERITDARFIEMGGDLEMVRTEFKTETAKISQTQDDNHREMMSKMDKLEEGQAMPWWIAAGTGVVGGVGVGGVGASQIRRRRTQIETDTEE